MDVELKNQGNAAFQAGKFEEAVELFSQAIAINPANHVYFSNRSGAYASMDKYEKALEDASKCVELKPDWPKGYVRKGLAQFYLDQHAEAEATYEAGLAIDPANAQLKEGLERCKSAGKPSGQDQFMQQMMMKLFNNPKTAAYMQDPAFVQKLTAIQQNPQSAAMYMNDPKIQEAFQVMFSDMGLNMEDLKKKAGAQEQPVPPQQQENFFQEEKKQEVPKQEVPKKEAPKKEEPKKSQRDLGNQAYKKKDFASAIQHYNQAFEEDKSDVLALNNLAAVYIEQGELEKALGECEKAVQAMDDQGIHDYVKRAKVYSRKASVLAKQRLFSDSIQWYEKSLLENQDFKVREELRSVQKLKKEKDEQDYICPAKGEEANEEAKVAFREGKWSEAIKLYDEAIKRNPQEQKYFCNKGITLMKLMDFSHALENFEKSLQLDPQNVKALAKKGNCYLMMKEYHKAMSTFEQGLKLDQAHQECRDGLQKTQMKIYSASGESKEEQEQRAAHGMADPEIQAILRDPTIVNLIRNLQENPRDKHIQEMMQDRDVAAKMNKLIAAGVLKMG